MGGARRRISAMRMRVGKMCKEIFGRVGLAMFFGCFGREQREIFGKKDGGFAACVSMSDFKKLFSPFPKH